MRVAFDEMPWLRREHLPTLRKWAELEVIRKAALRDGGAQLRSPQREQHRDASSASSRAAAVRNSTRARVAASNNSSHLC